MSEEITITKEDLVLWLDRPPSNDDLDLCEYLANAVQNRQKYYEKNQHLKENNKSIMEELLRVVGLYNQQKSVLDEIRKYLDEFIIYIDEDGEVYFKEEFRTEYNDLLEILDKVNKWN